MTMENGDVPGQGRRTLLVFGDWGIDDNWVTGTHRSRTSTRKGRAHYRTLHSPESTVQVFCGAGRNASLLHSSRNSHGAPLCAIVGLGLWHPDDTEVLSGMFSETPTVGRTPFRLHPPPHASPPPSLRLYNMSDAVK